MSRLDRSLQITSCLFLYARIFILLKSFFSLRPFYPNFSFARFLNSSCTCDPQWLSISVSPRDTAGHRGSVTSSSITDLWEWETCDVLHVRKTALHCSQEVTFRSNTDGKSGGGDSYVHSDMMATTAITFSKSLTHPRRRPPIALLTLPLPSAQLTSRRK